MEGYTRDEIREIIESLGNSRVIKAAHKDWDFDEDRGKVYQISLACYGDYDNSSDIERSNSAILLEEYDDIVWEEGAGYGSSLCFFGDDTLAQSDPEKVAEFLDILKGLENYPVINEEHLSQTEHDMIQETWDNCYRGDFEHIIRGYLEDCEDFLPLEDRIDFDPDPDTLDTIFWDDFYDSSAEFIIESGGGVYFDLKTYCDDDFLQGIKDIIESWGEFFTLLVNDKWYQTKLF